MYEAGHSAADQALVHDAFQEAGCKAALSLVLAARVHLQMGGDGEVRW